MKNKFKMPERFYFPMHMLGTAETVSVRPVEIDRGTGIVTAFIDIEKTNPVELAKLATMVFVEQLLLSLLPWCLWSNSQQHKHEPA